MQAAVAVDVRSRLRMRFRFSPCPERAMRHLMCLRQSTEDGGSAAGAGKLRPSPSAPKATGDARGSTGKSEQISRVELTVPDASEIDRVAQ
jgi:hypothetical protein